MVALIVAMDKQQTIGKNNALPWHFKEDLQYFKQKTLHKTVLMGRKTYESIVDKLGKPLPKRDNIVLTRQSKSFEGARVIHNIKAYLETIPNDMEVFIIGGKEVYEQSLPFVDVLYITHINDVYDGDTTFPEIDFQHYQLVKKEEKPPLTFAVYVRKGVQYDHDTL